ncbi:TPA: hypothetical protein ACGSKR_004775, partial [Escherichia coli]
RAGGIRTPEARRCTKNQHHIQKNNLIIHFLVHPVPLFLIQNTPHRRVILLIHIKLQGTSP